jgi:Protein of unknown function (DUF3800)
VNIYIDESGSFVNAPEKGSWNVVVAVATPESDRLAIDRIITALKLASLVPLRDEVKLNALDETRYLNFLNDLSKSHALLFATATDAGLNSQDRLARHQHVQVGKIRENISRMRYEGGRQGVILLADQLERISPQLYAQLVCQVDLLHDVVNRSINYFAQRIPGTLTEFRWRIDQKNTSKTTYEVAFEKIAPALLQTRSLREPGIWVEGFNYKHFSQYEFPDGAVPDYLESQYGLRVEHALNIQKLIRGNLRFEDSKCSLGIQVADLLASGFRRCLRGHFVANDAIAQSLGRLTLQNKLGKLPVHLVGFTEDEKLKVDQTASHVVKTMAKHSRAMLPKNTIAYKHRRA